MWNTEYRGNAGGALGWQRDYVYLGSRLLLAVSVHRDRQAETLETFTVTLSAVDPSLIVSPSTHVVTLEDVPPHPGDFDGDGLADLLWQHDGDGALSVWRMAGTTQLSGAALDPPAVADTTWKIVGVGDVDRDGDPDLYWQNDVSGDLAVWTMDGLQRISGDPMLPGNAGDVDWRVHTVADINATAGRISCGSTGLRAGWRCGRCTGGSRSAGTCWRRRRSPTPGGGSWAQGVSMATLSSISCGSIRPRGTWPGGSWMGPGRSRAVR